MSESIAQMAPMLIMAGLTIGWLSEALSRAGGYGFMYDMLLGLLGSIGLAAMIWIGISNDIGMVTMSLIGCIGGALAIVAQRSLWRSARPAA
jgi:uncharacterized membrane protein YeaQ/YmgE (transglycosylase-associated protein family)